MRYEEVGVFVVVVYVKLIGKIGVCMVIVGLGVIYLLNGLYDVKLDKVFVLVFMG